MECEGEQVHGSEHHGKVLLAVAEVVLEVVAVGLEAVEAFVLDLPSGPGAGHDLGDGVAGDGQRGHESAAVGDVPLASGRVTPIQLTSIASWPSRSGAPSNHRKR